MNVEDIVTVLQIGNITVSTAESCTGGLVAKKITDIPGASSVFQYGFITYSNEAKERLLGVDKKTLDKYTAVSEQVALQMARGAMSHSGAFVGVSVTGYAGGFMRGSEKDGLVFIAVANRDGYERAVKCYWPFTDRDKIREMAADEALNLILEGALKVSQRENKCL